MTVTFDKVITIKYIVFKNSMEVLFINFILNSSNHA